MIEIILLAMFLMVPLILWMWRWENKEKARRNNGLLSTNSGIASNSSASIRMGTTVPSITKKETS